MDTICLGGEIGRRKGLKIPRGQLHIGSSPIPGTKLALVKWTRVVYITLWIIAATNF